MKTYSFKKYDQLRIAKGLSMKALAKEAGFSMGTLTAWKRGSYEPKFDKIMKIAAVLGVDPMDLLA